MGVFIGAPSAVSSQSHRGLHRSPIAVPSGSSSQSHRSPIAIPSESSSQSHRSPVSSWHLALGKEKFVALAVEPKKVIQKAWKNRVQNKSKERKSGATSGAGPDEALVLNPAVRDYRTNYTCMKPNAGPFVAISCTCIVVVTACIIG
jgi:hypothetical protein